MSSRSSGSTSGRQPGVGRDGLDPMPCTEFERTTLLIDGLLSGAALRSALGHCATCAVCGPLVSGWNETSSALVASLEDAAERAKPELVGVADRVFQRIDSEGIEPVEVPTYPALRRFYFRLKPWLGLGAATAAIALTVGPLLGGGTSGDGADELARAESGLLPDGIESVPPSTRDVSQAGAVASRLAADGATADETATDCIVRKLSFDGADGMVYRAGTDGMTVIWINEHEGV